MESVINICCGACTDELVSGIIGNISPEAIDSIYTTEHKNGNRIRHFIKLRTRCNLQKSVFADFLSGWIIKNFEQKIMCEILKLNFSGLTLGDVLKIVKVTENKIKEEEHKIYSILVKNELFDYLSSNNILNIDGFVRFRLKEYRERLEETLYAEIDEYLAEKEYEAFIDMLCEYIDTRYPVLDLIHIKEKPDGSFSLYDFSQNNISVACENELSLEISDAFLSHEDKLLSILLILIPRRIIWHKCNEINRSNLFNTVGQIFKDRLSVCCGCNLCDS